MTTPINFFPLHCMLADTATLDGEYTSASQQFANSSPFFELRVLTQVNAARLIMNSSIGYHKNKKWQTKNVRVAFCGTYRMIPRKNPFVKKNAVFN